MEREQENIINKNGSYIIKETIKQTPEDGFVPDRIMEPTNPDTYGKYHKGHKTTVTYTTNDPRITRLFAYGICGLFFAIGIILLLCRVWIIAIPFIAISSFVFYKSKKDIDAIAAELKKNGQDVTKDSKEKLKEIAGEVADSSNIGFDKAKKATFTKESYQWFLKATIPIYCIIVIFVTILFAIFVNVIFALILSAVLALFGVLYYKIIKKICRY